MKPRLSRHFSRACLSVAGIFITATQVHAADHDWDAGGGANTDFSTSANWNDNTVPVGGDNAFINVTGTATITADVASAGGRLNVLEVGRWFGSGTVTQTAGTVYTAGFNVGFLGTGVYNLNGSGSINMTNDFLLGKAGGAADSGNGTLNMNTSGTFTTNKFRIADDSWGSTVGPSGTFNLSAGTVTSTYGFTVGGGATGTTGLATMNMSGGVVNSNGNFVIGDSNDGAQGAFVMTGGVLNVTGPNGTEFWVGNGHNGDYSKFGSGSATVSSGTLNVGSWLGVGRFGSQGTFTISGDAVVNQGVTDAGANLELGNFNAGGTATLNLDGGTLQTNGIYDNGGATSSTTFNLNGGTLKARKDNGDFLNADTVYVKNGGAVIDTNGFNIGIDNALVANGTGGLTKNGAGTLTLSNANTFTGAVVVNAGTLVLNAGNTYSGGTTVSAGRIEVTNSTALGSGAVSIAAGANVFLNANSLTIANDFTLNGTTSGGALVSGDRPGGNVTTLSGTITLAADSNIASWWNDKQLTLSGKITGSGSLTFDRATALGDPVGGKFLISGTTNDYTGSTTVNGRSGGNAILQLGAANALPTGTTLTLNDANLILNGFNQTLGGLVASTTTSQIVNGNATAVTLTVSNAAANTFAGVLGGFGTNENNFALTKGGAGTLTLSGANTFTGATTINAGTLKVSGSIGNSAVTVANNGTLASGTTGTIGSSVSVSSGGTLAAGGVGAIGTATVGSGGLALSSGSIFAWDLNGATGSLATANQGSYDKVVSNGTMSGTSIFNVVLGTSDFTDTFWNSTHTWSDIFTGAGVPTDLAAIFSTFSGTGVNTDGSVTGQGGFTFNGSTTLTWSAVPEPTSACAGLLLTAGLLRRRRKN